MSTISSNNDPTNAPYHFLIDCSPNDKTVEKCKEGKGS